MSGELRSGIPHRSSRKAAVLSELNDVITREKVGSCYNNKM